MIEIDRLSKCVGSVLVLGELGSGCRSIERLLQNGSDASAAPFITYNCDAVSTESLQEHLLCLETSCIAQADGGTLFLSKIDKLSLQQQGLLLLALAETNSQFNSTQRPRRNLRSANNMNCELYYA